MWSLPPLKTKESLDGPSINPNQVKEGSLMVGFSSPSLVLIPAVFIPENNKDALEDRENGDYYIDEGDLILKCNEVDTHPIT